MDRSRPARPRRGAGSRNPPRIVKLPAKEAGWPDLADGSLLGRKVSGNVSAVQCLEREDRFFKLVPLDEPAILSGNLMLLQVGFRYRIVPLHDQLHGNPDALRIRQAFVPP